MAVLARPVALHDIENAEAFCQAQLNASKRVYGPDEREELVAEGLAILCQLAAGYKPRMAGYTADGRFSGYAARFLRLKLEDAYHRLHPEHRLVAQPDGKRRYAYGDKPVSLDALTESDPDRTGVLADDIASLDALTVARRAHKALWDRWTKRVELWADIAGLLAEGATDADIALIKGVTAQQVREAKQVIAQEMPYIIGGEAA